MYMIMMVLRDPNRLEELLETWHGIAVHPLGILESTTITRQTGKHFGARFALWLALAGLRALW